LTLKKHYGFTKPEHYEYFTFTSRRIESIPPLERENAEPVTSTSAISNQLKRQLTAILDALCGNALGRLPASRHRVLSG